MWNPRTIDPLMVSCDSSTYLIEKRDVAARAWRLHRTRTTTQRWADPCSSGAQQVGFDQVHVGPVVAIHFHEVELVLDLGGSGIVASFIVAALGHLGGADRRNEAGGINRRQQGHQDFKSLRSRRRDHHHVSSAGHFAFHRDHSHCRRSPPRRNASRVYAAVAPGTSKGDGFVWIDLVDLAGSRRQHRTSARAARHYSGIVNSPALVKTLRSNSKDESVR